MLAFCMADQSQDFEIGWRDGNYKNDRSRSFRHTAVGQVSRTSNWVFQSIEIIIRIQMRWVGRLISA